MAKTKFDYISGMTEWFRHTTPDKWGSWKHNLTLDAASVKKVEEWKQQGLMNKVEKTDDGWKMTIRRPTQKTYGNKVVGFAPPLVLGPDGLPLVDVMVGNGSLVTTKVALYEFNRPTGGKGLACRWEASRVDKLVPFTVKDGFDPTGGSPSEAQQARGVMEQPEPLF